MKSYIFFTKKIISIAREVISHRGIANKRNLNFFSFPEKLDGQEKILFILGSGASISKYTHEDFELIGNNHSAALNFWLIHPFVPTYFFFEGFKDDSVNEKIFIEWMKERSEDYKKTIKFYSGNNRSYSIIDSLPPTFKESLAVFPRTSSFTSSIESLNKALSNNFFQSFLLKIFKFFSFSTGFVSTVPHMVIFGLLSGYKKIILCGVDMVNNDYFFLKENFISKDCKMPVIHFSSVHPTIQSQKKMTTDKVLLSLNAYLLRPMGVKLLQYKKFYEDHPLEELGYYK